MAPEVNSMQCCCTAGPGIGQVLSEEMAPWNPSTARDLRLPEDNRTLHPQGSVCVVNIIHALHVKDVKDCKNTCIVVICTNVKDCKNTCIVLICTDVKDVEDCKKYWYLIQDDQAHQCPRVEVYDEKEDD